VGLVDGAHEHHVRLVTSDQIRPEPSGGSFHLERTYPARAPRCHPTSARWGPPFISSHEFVHICRCHPPDRFRTVGGPAVEIQPIPEEERACPPCWRHRASRWPPVPSS